MAVPVLPIAVLVVVGAVFVFAYRRGKLLKAALGVLVLAVLALGLSTWAVATDYRDADGFVDCWPHCTKIQNATGAAFFLAPMVALIAVVATVVASLRR